MPFPTYSIIKLIAIGALCLHSLTSYGEGFKVIRNAEDNIVKMHGYIYDTISDHPNRVGVLAKIILESMPHGSEIGIISSNDTSGYYEYFINLKYTYRIDVRSENHRWHFEMLESKKAVANGEITRNFYLEPQVKENQVIRLKKLIFEQGKSSITPDSYGELNKIVNLMNENSSMQIQLEGHTDYRGSKRLNMELSQQRVEAVKAYLVGQGMNAKRIKTKAYGGSKPIIKERSIEASELNRRVEVRILKLN